ncbi:hypothetical protein ACOME3_001856 [Neoechinorhynchus agilis]
MDNEYINWVIDCLMDRTCSQRINKMELNKDQYRKISKRKKLHRLPRTSTQMASSIGEPQLHHFVDAERLLNANVRAIYDAILGYTDSASLEELNDWLKKIRTL